MEGLDMSNKDCLVTVMCAAFNHEEYIRSALEGFVNQKTDFGFEVLINDDKSTDNTAAVIREYAEKYPEIIRPFYQEVNLYSLHKDVYDEFFYPNARGKYVAFCEGDDYWVDPLKLQKQVDFMEAHPKYSACVHNSIVHDCSGSSPDRPFIPKSGDHDLFLEDAVKGMSHAYHTSSLLAKKDIIADHKDFYFISCSYGFSDYPDALRLLLDGPIRFLDEDMSVYRLCSNPGSWSSKLSSQYKKLHRFIVGEKEMLTLLKAHVKPEQLPAIEHEILEREYELLFIEGKADEMVKPPYREIYKKQSLSYKLKITLKRLFPRLHAKYREKRGYEE